jgi:hypothetical protein
MWAGRLHVSGPDVGTGATLFAVATDPEALTSAVVGSKGSAFPLEVTGDHFFAHRPHSLGLAEDASEAAPWTTLAASSMTEQPRRAALENAA